jgi:hypothetical protein
MMLLLTLRTRNLRHLQGVLSTKAKPTLRLHEPFIGRRSEKGRVTVYRLVPKQSSNAFSAVLCYHRTWDSCSHSHFLR